MTELTWASVVPMLLASAAVGAFVSSMVQLVGGWLERKSRRREMLLKAALEMAAQRTEVAIRAADAAGTSTKLHDSVFLAERYFQWLMHLERTGSLPEEAKAFGRASGFYK